MGNYDRILTFDHDGLGCNDCHFNKNCSGGLCSDGKPEGIIDDDYHYANGFQLKGLIAEAESGAHEWVRDNTKLICENAKDDECRQCYHSEAHRRYDVCHDNSCLKWKRTKCIPYRGSKSEEKTWPGRSDEDCSEVESSPKWDDDGKGCNTCGNQRGDLQYNCALSEDCGLHLDYCMYEREKEESEDMGKEYVVLKGITLFSLSNQPDINAYIFLEIYKRKPYIDVSEGSVLHSSGLLYKYKEELLRLGFIEEKVFDPVVKKMDKFTDGKQVFMVCVNGDGILHLMNLDIGMPFSLDLYGPVGNCNLSDLVGKSRLKEFKPVKVDIKVVEDS